MLVEFSVSNFRSFAEGQKLSLAASVGARRRNHLSVSTGNSYAPRVLRSACLLGPNASGKTSLIAALAFFRSFIVSSAKDATESELIRARPFKLDKKLQQSPTMLEAVFIVNGSLYQYGYSYDANRIWAEWMYVRNNQKNSRMREVFSREYDAEEDSYSWSINELLVKGDREVWKSSTRSNALFFSTAVQLNADYFKSPFRWVNSYLRVVDSPSRLHHATTAKLAMDNDGEKQTLRFLAAADLKISRLEVEEEDANIPDDISEMFNESFLERIKNNIKGEKEYNVRIFRKSRQDRDISFEMSEESDGTRVLFSLAGPWMDVLENGYTLVVDELHNSLHPLVLRFLVSLFHDPELNKQGAQLLFTSHETSVISRAFMHRDQIWLIERGGDGASSLVPLSEFSVREIDAFQRAYLGGRFGGLPNIGSFRLGQ